MSTYDMALLAGFRSMLSYALGNAKDTLGVKSFSAYHCAGTSESYIACFELTGERPPQVIAYLPPEADAAERELFTEVTERLQSFKPAGSGGDTTKSAAEAIAGLEPLTAEDTLAVLDTLLDVLDGKLEGGLLRYSKSLNEADIRAALLDANLSARSAEERVQGLIDTRLDFVLAALDVLAAEVTPRLTGPQEAQTFELYAFSDDPLSTIFVRNFDHDTASVYFVLSSLDGPEHSAFDKAVDQFVFGRINGESRELALSRAGGCLQSLPLKAACERLGRLLGEDAERGLAQWEPLITGTLTQSVRQALEEISLDEQTTQRDLSPDTQPRSMFHAARSLIQELRGEPVWSEDLEAIDDVRIEVLTHKKHPDSTILLSFSPLHEQAALMWSVYSEDPSALPTIIEDLNQMLLDRHCRRPQARPLSAKHAFKRIDSSAVEARIETVLSALAAGKGSLCEELEPREFPLTSSKSSAKAVKPGVTSHTLH